MGKSMSFLGKEKTMDGLADRLGLKADESDTVYRYIGGDAQEGILSCGYMLKSASKTQSNFVIPYYSCFFLLEGTGEYRDESGRVFALRPGSVVQRIPDVTHTTRVDQGSGWTEFYISFGRSFYQALKSVRLLKEEPVRYADPLRFRTAEYDRLLKRMKQAGDRELYPILLDAQALVLPFFSGPEERKAEQDGWLSTACRIFERNYFKKDAAREAAAELSMGYETFRKNFTKKMGVSPGAYLMERKMMTAKMMLLSGQSVKQVAGNLGYGDASIFSKQFKRFAGTAPSGYTG